MDGGIQFYLEGNDWTKGRRKKGMDYHREGSRGMIINISSEVGGEPLVGGG